jgi:translation initiation factor 2 beta subunit (eIF-2beta)/eIF-5
MWLWRASVVALRFQDGYDEVLERLSAIEQKLEELSAINATHELRRDLKRIPYQLECMRRLQQIESDLLELRTNAAMARFAKEGESGYIPKQLLGEDRWFAVPLDESEARSSTIRDFCYIEERLNEFILPEYQGDPLDPCLGLIGLCIDLEHLQRSVREEARKSPNYSLNKVALSGVFLTNQLHEMLERMDMRYKELERTKEIEDKKNARAQWASERTQKGQLPLPD